MSKPIELREQTIDELNDKLKELREEQFNLRFQMATGQLDNHRRIRFVRREIARVLTVIRELEIAEYAGATQQEATAE